MSCALCTCFFLLMLTLIRALQPKFDSKPKIKEPEIPVDQLRIGREEDTRQNCLSLMPKPPKPNWLQFQNCSGQVMRFYAWMADDPDSGFCIRSESDRQRRFVVSYHLVDDTVAIFEPPVRNSGIVGGKFLERGVLRKPGHTKTCFNLAVKSSDW